jgi:hypothetical protein
MIDMTVRDAIVETLDDLPISEQKELLRFARVLESGLTARRRLGNRSKQTKPRKSRIVMDEELGLPVLDAGPDAPMLTNEIVREILADFP